MTRTFRIPKKQQRSETKTNQNLKTKTNCETKQISSRFPAMPLRPIPVPQRFVHPCEVALRRIQGENNAKTRTIVVISSFDKRICIISFAQDCTDGTDEKNCTAVSCPDNKFNCPQVSCMTWINLRPSELIYLKIYMRLQAHRKLFCPKCIPSRASFDPAQCCW